MSQKGCVRKHTHPTAQCSFECHSFMQRSHKNAPYVDSNTVECDRGERHLTASPVIRAAGDCCSWVWTAKVNIEAAPRLSERMRGRCHLGASSLRSPVTGGPTGWLTSQPPNSATGKTKARKVTNHKTNLFFFLRWRGLWGGWSRGTVSRGSTRTLRRRANGNAWRNSATCSFTTTTKKTPINTPWTPLTTTRCVSI